MSTSLGNSVVYYAPKDVRIEPMTSLPATGKGEVLVKVEASAICGTDIKSYLKGNPRIQPPMVMGHEFCGTIVEVGDEVEGYTVGQRVTMATTIGCGECVYCKKGKTNMCRSAEAIGFHYPGAMAPYVRIPAKAVRQKHLVDVGDLDAAIAALGEPMSCAINDLTRVPREEVNSAIIIGLGPLGMLHAVAAREMGIENICLVEFPGKRMEMAKELGFTQVYAPEQLENVYKDLTGGEGFDLVIVTAPHNGTQGKAPMFARKGGYVSFFASLPPGDEMLSVNSRTIHYNELIVYGTSDSTVKHVQDAVKLLRANPESFRPLVTHIMPIADFHKAMDEIAAGNVVKAVLVP